MRRLFKIFPILLFLAFIGIQFIEVERTNPPITADLQAPFDIKNIFKKACYDCHSNETVWPWYSKVAPVSWFIIKDVKDGRNQLNFSEWEKLNRNVKEKRIKAIWEQINNDEMPLNNYKYLHPDSKLDIIQKNLIKKWMSSFVTM